MWVKKHHLILNLCIIDLSTNFTRGITEATESNLNNKYGTRGQYQFQYFASTIRFNCNLSIINRINH